MFLLSKAPSSATASLLSFSVVSLMIFLAFPLMTVAAKISAASTISLEVPKRAQEANDNAVAAARTPATSLLNPLLDPFILNPLKRCANVYFTTQNASKELKC